MRIQTLKVIEGISFAHCLHGMSPTVECIQSRGIKCPCGYAEGLTKPNYPVPAIRHIIEILPNAVFYYENDEQGHELIVYYANKNPNIWG